MKELLSFQDLGISPKSLQAVKEMGFTTPSPIQSQAIPKLLKGSDLIGQAQTGTGKTAAFGIPLLDSIHKSYPGVQGLVLCPTDEADEMLNMGFRDDMEEILGEIPETRQTVLFSANHVQAHYGHCLEISAETYSYQSYR